MRDLKEIREEIDQADDRVSELTGSLVDLDIKVDALVDERDRELKRLVKLRREEDQVQWNERLLEAGQ